jgi:putative oxidoreductase
LPILLSIVDRTTAEPKGQSHKPKPKAQSLKPSARKIPVDGARQEGYERLAVGQLAPHLQSVARIIFGFLVLRHGMEQVLAYPEASHAPRVSFEGALELVAFPAGLLIILGLYTRQIGLVLAVLYFILFFLGPLQRGPFTHRNGGDPILLDAFFLLYLSAAGAGPWSLDRLRGATAADTRWAPVLLSVLRIAAGCLFLMHGLEKIFGVGGGRIDRDITTIRGLAGWLEIVGGPLFTVGLFTRPVAFLLSGEMAVAYFRSWAPRGFWRSFEQAGMEASILFCFLFLFFWAAGPGAWSIDTLRGRKR